MTKREALFFVIGLQTATLIVFFAWKFKCGVFNPNFHQRHPMDGTEEVRHG